jgi:hypothetical protein
LERLAKRLGWELRTKGEGAGAGFEVLRDPQVGDPGAVTPRPFIEM